MEDVKRLADFTAPGKVSVIIDGQFGSTGKGLIAAYVAKNCGEFEYAITNASANAGHTTVIGERKFTTFHMPTSAVINSRSVAYLDAGAIIDPQILFQELEEFDMWDRVAINPYAAVIQDEHRDYEKAKGSRAGSIGSTQKGVGAALMDKVARKGNIAGLDKFLKPLVREISPQEIEGSIGAILEVPQGFSLGLNSGFYPYCTSREVTVTQAMADARLHPSLLHKTMMCVRTLPIRVGNIYGEDGKITGWSGPCYPDQNELDWENLGIKPELTTVTKRPRRIFTFSGRQYSDSLSVLKPDHVFLNFCNYLDNAGVEDMIGRMSRRGKKPDFLGFGPDIKDVVPTKEWQDRLNGALNV